EANVSWLSPKRPRHYFQQCLRVVRFDQKCFDAELIEISGVHRLSIPESQIMTGAVSARIRNRSSLACSVSSACCRSVISASTPIICAGARQLEIPGQLQ